MPRKDAERQVPGTLCCPRSWKAPNSDKSSILGDATRALLQLKGEAQELKEANETLQESIKDLKFVKNLKETHKSSSWRENSVTAIGSLFYLGYVILQAEKNELRDEKMKLKGEKERLEQQIKMMSMSPAGFVQPHPAIAFHAAAAAFATQTQASSNKTVAFPAYTGPPTWQWLPHGLWLPPASRDTTEDPKQISPSA